MKRICFIMLCKNKAKYPVRSAFFIFINNNNQIVINRSLLTSFDQIPNDCDDDLIAKNETNKLFLKLKQTKI